MNQRIISLEVSKFLMSEQLDRRLLLPVTPGIYAAAKARLISPPGQLLFISIFSNIFEANLNAPRYIHLLVSFLKYD